MNTGEESIPVPHSFPIPVSISHSKRAYRCPGESAEISEAVHFSRLSTFYHKCQLCEHRAEMSRLAPSVQRQWHQLSGSSDPVRIFQTNGIRGRYLNRITRHEAAQVAIVFAQTLREVAEFWRTERKLPLPERWIKVAFGHDSRPSSPDLAIAAANALRHYGCELIDLGQTTRPLLEAVIREQAVDGAFLVSGHGSPAGWNGFDLLGPDGVIWSLGGLLDLVEQRFHEHCTREERTAASAQQIDLIQTTAERFQKSLHGIRPFRVMIEVQDPVTEEILRRSESAWPGEFRMKTQNDRGADPELPADVNFHIAEDGIACRLQGPDRVDMSVDRILLGLGELLLDEHPHVDLVLSEDCLASLGWAVQRCGPGYLVAHPGGSTEESLIRTMRSMAAQLGTDGAGRFWVRRGAHILGDALQTVALILKSLSQTDLSLDQWGRESQPR